MGTESNQEQNMSSLEVDTIGEILNISMGAAATAISTMLDKQVIISTPSVELKKFSSKDYVSLEPAMMVVIHYIEGIAGTNVMIFRQQDMQIILNLLMGNDDPPDGSFEFDELGISAACEVMNQMMGASATALADFLGMAINISPPEAIVVDSENVYRNAVKATDGDRIVAVSFSLNIEGVMNSEFASIMSCELAKDIISRVMTQQEEQIEAIKPATPPPAAPAPAPVIDPQLTDPQPIAAPAPAPTAAPVQQQPVPTPTQPMATPAPEAASAAQAAPMAAPSSPMQGGMGQMPPYPGAPMQMPGMPPMQYSGMPPIDYAQQGWYGYMPPYPYPPQGYPPAAPSAAAALAAAAAESQKEKEPAFLHQPVNVKNTQFPQFTVQTSQNPNSNANMDLLLGVNLDVSVEIGKAKRKIKDIVEFGQGTVIELNKQAGAPVDIMVNGRLLARGDVVVIDDNFGVRITEIIGTKELMESLKEENL